MDFSVVADIRLKLFSCVEQPFLKNLFNVNICYWWVIVMDKLARPEIQVKYKKMKGIKILIYKQNPTKLKVLY